MKLKPLILLGLLLGGCASEEWVPCSSCAGHNADSMPDWNCDKHDPTNFAGVCLYHHDMLGGHMVTICLPCEQATDPAAVFVCTGRSRIRP